MFEIVIDCKDFSRYGVISAQDDILRLQAKLQEIITIMPADGICYLDCSGIFFDDPAAKILWTIEALGWGPLKNRNKHIVFMNLNDQALKTLVKGSEVWKKGSTPVCFMYINDGVIRVAGGNEEVGTVIDTLLSQGKELQADELAEMTGSTAQKVSRALHKLSMNGILSRRKMISEGGRPRYSYSIFRPNQANG